MLCALPLHFTLIYSFTLKFDYILVNFVVFYIYLDIINFEIVKLNKKTHLIEIEENFDKFNGSKDLTSHVLGSYYVPLNITTYTLMLHLFFGEYI